MAELKGGTILWDDTDHDDDTNPRGGTGIVQGSLSEAAVIGPGPQVVVLIDGSNSSGGGTFTIQVAATSSPRAGLNALDSLEQPDLGLVWAVYDGAEDLAVASGEARAFDLSPFGPTLLRLIRTDATGADDFTAIVVSYGDN